jgi:hypothetical protein
MHACLFTTCVEHLTCDGRIVLEHAGVNSQRSIWRDHDAASAINDFLASAGGFFQRQLLQRQLRIRLCNE